MNVNLKYVLAIILAIAASPLVIHASYVATVIINQQSQESLLFSVSQVQPVTMPSGSSGVVTFQIPLTYAGPYYLGGVSVGLSTCSGSVVSQNPINMGWLSPGQTVDLEFQVNSSVPLNCVGSISISWTGLFKFNSSSQSYVQEGGSGSTSIKISEYAQGAPLLSVSINSTQMPLLVNTPVEIVVKNNGSGPIYNLLVQTQASGAFINGSFSGSIYRADLPSGGSLSFMELVSPTSSQAEISVTISGVNAAGQPYSSSYQQALTITPLPSNLQSTVSLGVNETELVLGENSPVSLAVAEAGGAMRDFELMITPINMYVNGSSLPVVVNIGNLSGSAFIHLMLTPISSNAELSISYSGVNVAGQTVTGTGTAAFIVRQQPLAISASLIPSIAYAGNPTRFDLIITNNSTLPISNVTITVASSIPLINSTYPPKLVIGKMAPGESDDVVLTAVPIQGAQFTVQYSYVQGSNYVQGTLSLSPLVKQPQAPLVWVGNNTLGIGDNKIVITVENPSPIPISDVVLTIDQYSGFTLIGPTAYELGYLGPGQSATADIPILVPVSSTSAGLSYSLSYVTGNGQSAEQGSLTFSVISPSNVVISSVVISPTPPGIDSPITLSLTFINTGIDSIYDVNASVKSDMAYISQPSTFYGEISPQTPTAGAFTFQTSKPGVHFINLTITYMDQYGHEMSVSKYIRVYVTNSTYSIASTATGSRRSFGGGGGGFGGFGAAAVVTAVAAIIVVSTLLVIRRRVGHR
ncbi:hypothetical protein GCM10007981_05300 [Thermocladium modestius]|uniref:Uncharacterized protein n=1 Tax=Thermocladium modestius TaxID=62609 RepID=A0A830GSX0_9CREN|nr:hypothetical protein [Thermocladium modestius]GGP19870.1 hypothetical protein GCM10007981_05300 [Thermocladium modestius]